LSGSPIPTNNNTCPITTAVSTLTKYATLYSGNYTSTTTETQYINALPNNASTVTQVSLVTVVITDPFTTTTDSTTTVTEYLTNTETETTIFTTTAGGNPVGGRFGRTWWMF
jgi:uracil phosphoribosyltransferase